VVFRVESARLGVGAKPSSGWAVRRVGKTVQVAVHQGSMEHPLPAVRSTAEKAREQLSGRGSHAMRHISFAEASRFQTARALPLGMARQDRFMNPIRSRPQGGRPTLLRPSLCGTSRMGAWTNSRQLWHRFPQKVKHDRLCPRLADRRRPTKADAGSSANGRQVHGVREPPAEPVYNDVQLKNARSSVVVVVGVNFRPGKEEPGIPDGLRETQRSGTGLLLELKASGT
jgi:hypothetical protein